MKELKLTILVEPGKKASVINALGSDYIVVGDRVKFMQYTFSDVKMLTPFKLAPLLHLISAYETQNGTMRYKMFHLKDDKDSSYSPVYFECMDAEWSVVSSQSGTTLKSGKDLLNLL